MELQSEIREERPEDIDAIREVNNDAFGEALEGEIVDALRANGAVLLSLVALLNGKIVGHILYSPIIVNDVFEGAALGPMSVLPEYQKQGVGSRLIEAGNRKLRDSGCPFIIVIGHAEYYPRFGFEPAGAFGITCQWPVPDEVFMVLPLDPVRIQRIRGPAKYRPEFSSAI